MKNARYVKMEKQTKRHRKIRSSEPLPIKEILPDTMHEIRLKMDRWITLSIERNIG